MESIKIYERPNEIFPVLCDLINELGWKIIEIDNCSNRIHATTGFSLRSWGETVIISIKKSGNNSIVEIRSQSSAQIFDWGKNKDNEEGFIRELKKIYG